MCSRYQTQASGLIGSPTEPSRRREERSCFCGVFRSPLHVGPDRRRRRVEDVDLVALDDRPPAVLVGVVGDAFVDDAGGAVAERPVDDVAVAGDPADVGRAPVHRVGLDVEDVVVGRRGADEVARGRVGDPLRLRGGAARVEEVEQVLRVHRLARARLRVGALALDELVPPEIAALLERHVAAGAPQHDRVADARRGGERGVRVSLQRHRAAVAQALVLRDQDLAAHVVHAIRQGIRGKPAEDDRVRRAEPGAGEHRHRGLGDHPHVDPDRRALPHAQLLEGVREAHHLRLEVGERDRPPLVLGLALPVVGDLVAVPGLDVPIDAVVGDVELAADVPLRVRLVPLVERLEVLEPGDPLAALRLPELLVVALVDLGLRVRLGGKLGRRRIPPLLQQDRLDRGRHALRARGRTGSPSGPRRRPR